jgi:hypothetical protein
VQPAEVVGGRRESKIDLKPIRRTRYFPKPPPSSLVQSVLTFLSSSRLVVVSSRDARNSALVCLSGARPRCDATAGVVGGVDGPTVERGWADDGDDDSEGDDDGYSRDATVGSTTITVATVAGATSAAAVASITIPSFVKNTHALGGRHPSAPVLLPPAQLEKIQGGRSGEERTKRNGDNCGSDRQLPVLTNGRIFGAHVPAT